MAVFSLGFTHTHTQRNNRENQFNSDRLGGKAEIGSETIGGNPVKRCFAATESVTGSSTKDHLASIAIEPDSDELGKPEHASFEINTAVNDKNSVNGTDMWSVECGL